VLRAPPQPPQLPSCPDTEAAQTHSVGEEFSGHGKKDIIAEILIGSRNFSAPSSRVQVKGTRLGRSFRKWLRGPEDLRNERG